ncbi:hypothetical protein LZD49_22595 [Dyadobacter sp. CY261]|uniref:hypothetical protein n=1 Tax=Dyadobacter sp. CY261 TaxID=2907203 RepID=UPI001F23ED29|nr:hypothetical protein [Dyadobacter sp. CY261]MCF0073285.1 hypothetical protein [Dyadobacter sp. CY261]
MMTIRSAFALLVIASLLSCSGKSGPDDGQTADTATEDTAAKTGAVECFAYKMQKDSALLRLEIADNAVSGELSYALYEKDRNQGSIAGIIHSDTIFARYTFASEGSTSVREVAFLKSGSGWIEGFGDVVDSSGVLIFKDRSKLNFEKGMQFEPAECARGAQ